jgi:inner membrane protein
MAGVAFIILFPVSLIDGKIAERRNRAESVERQFASETSGPQTIVGPLLALTCEETFTEERQIMRAGKAETVAERKVGACPTGYFSPRTLKVAGDLPVDSRYRGIYPIRLYRASLEMKGEIEWPAPPASDTTNQRAWKQAYLVIAVSDPRGIKSVSTSRSADFDARFAIRDDLGSYKSRKAGEALPFAYKIQLVGTSSLAISPVGDTNEIRLASDWPHPSFTGNWTPDERRITREGFEAVWRTTHHATGGQTVWEKQARDGTLFKAPAVAGVSLFDPVNVYALSYRATEYGFLFVLFTFTALALTEAIAGVRLHAIQYLLVGSALAVFFLLLLALSEHISFGRAYFAAAAACVSLLSYYLWHAMGSLVRSAAFFALFVSLYATLYVVLKSEDDALLLGSLLIFTALAVAMIATRKVDWAAMSKRMLHTQVPPAPAAQP